MNRSAHHPAHTFEPAEADIQRCAYFLWLEEGRPTGQDLDIWLTAKELLKHRAASHRPELAQRSAGDAPRRRRRN
ncbi:MAG: DUF2934 domain-containing protein [Opitutae bacterium]|nr:DUF2934 domain-containing protein [Opitutae bacterium]